MGGRGPRLRAHLAEEIRQNAVFKLADRHKLDRLRGILPNRGIGPDDGTA
jgi:hypothetical protein